MNMPIKETLPPPSNRGVSPPTKASNPNPKPDKPEAWGVGVDWITCTTTKRRIGYAWYDLLRKEAEKNELDRLDAKDWKALGYVGITWGPIRWGFSERHGFIAIASGRIADEIWPKIVPPIGKVTRIDLRVDVILAEPALHIAGMHFGKLDQSHKSKRRYTLITNTQGGQTLYVGSRNSAQYGRIYDKSAEAGNEPGYVWRYEVEIKKPLSLPLATELYRHWESGNRHWDAIIGYVWAWFDGRGVYPIFQPAVNRTIVLEPQYQVTSLERKLTWLRTQVQPTIYKLIKAGYEEKTLAALGLADLDKIRPGEYIYVDKNQKGQ